MAATTTRRRAAIYARISDDRDDTGLGVARQESDCRARVDTEGWDLVGTYIDNDISAFSGRPRPRWEALVADVRSGDVDRIVCWAADRLTRSLRELEDLVELLNETGVRIIALKDGEYDLSTSGGRMIARILGSVARQESERKSERQRRKAEEIALTGRPGGGGTRAFGYEDDAITINPAEATAIRDAAVRILAGETLNSILKDWHARGIESVMGGSMSATSFRRMMISPRIAGLRAFRGQIIGDAIWPAILDRDTWEKLRVVLTDPSRNKVRNPSRYLLTGGLLICARCHRPMGGRPTEKGRKAYQCIIAKPGAPNCGRMKIGAADLEAHVRDEILSRLARGRTAQALSDEVAADIGADVDHVLTEIGELKTRLVELEVDYYQERLISRPTYLDSRLRIVGRLDDLESQLATGPDVPITFHVGDDLPSWWEAMPIEDRRATAARLIDEVVIRPAIRGRNFYDPARVTVNWSS